MAHHFLSTAEEANINTQLQSTNRDSEGEMRQTSQEINLIPNTYNETEKLL